MQQFDKDFQDRKGSFEVNFHIKSQKEIVVDGAVMGVLYELADLTESGV
jgi:hypothetical protein